MLHIPAPVCVYAGGWRYNWKRCSLRGQIRGLGLSAGGSRAEIGPSCRVKAWGTDRQTHTFICSYRYRSREPSGAARVQIISSVPHSCQIHQNKIIQKRQLSLFISFTTFFPRIARNSDFFPLNSQFWLSCNSVYISVEFRVCLSILRLSYKSDFLSGNYVFILQIWLFLNSEFVSCNSIFIAIAFLSCSSDFSLNLELVLFLTIASFYLAILSEFITVYIL